MKGSLSIPVEFWAGITFDEFSEIVDRGGLDQKDCRRLWKILGRQDTPPKSMELLIKADDLFKLFPPAGLH